MSNPRTLSKGDKESFEKNIDQLRKDEVVSSSPVLNIEEAPFVQSSRIRVEDVSRVLVHRHRAFGNSDDLECSPEQSSSHCEEIEDRKNDFSGGVSDGQFPQTQNAHLGISDENLYRVRERISSKNIKIRTYNSEQDALQDDLPAVAEVLEFFTVDPALSDGHFDKGLEEGDA